MTAEISGDHIVAYKDSNGDRFTFKKVNGGFDIFKNGSKIDVGAKTKGDIRPTIEHYKDTEKRLENHKKETKNIDGFSSAIKSAMFPKTYTDKPKDKQPYHKNDGLDIFRDIAMNSKDAKEFIDKTREFNFFV